MFARAVATLLCVLAALACGGPAEHGGVGEVIAIDSPRLHATIRHEDIPGVMRAMTMRFPAASPDVLAGIAAGDRVRFTMRRRGGGWELTGVSLLAAADAPAAAAPAAEGEGVHDHTPHHGGVVGMSGELHLEARAEPDGTVRVWVTDFWRRPRPADDVSGSVTLELPEGDRELALRRVEGALEASGPPLAHAEVGAHVALAVGGAPVEMDFLLPVQPGAAGAAGVPLAGCIAPPATAGEGPPPRCAIDFGRSVSALAASADGTTLLVAGVDLGVSVWRLPEGRLSHAFAAPPPLAVPGPEGLRPHSEAANAIALGADGQEAVVALEARLLRYAVATGRLLLELPAQRGVVRDVDWAPDGTSLLVSVFYDPAARLLRLPSGGEWGRLAVEREAAAVAFSPDGRLAAVGSEAGPIVLFDLATAAASHHLAGGAAPVAALAFAGDRLVAAGSDGVLRVFDVASGRLAAEAAAGAALAALAAAPDGRRVAAAGVDGVVHLHDLGEGGHERLDWHRVPVHALAWSGAVLASGDARGRVAFWDLPG
jgi:WD40 repeat protein/Cu/Ag efflux protein CusF